MGKDNYQTVVQSILKDELTDMKKLDKTNRLEVTKLFQDYAKHSTLRKADEIIDCLYELYCKEEKVKNLFSLLLDIEYLKSEGFKQSKKESPYGAFSAGSIMWQIPPTYSKNPIWCFAEEIKGGNESDNPNEWKQDWVI